MPATASASRAPLLALLLFSACLGSCGTASTRGRVPLGAYPMQAVAYDLVYMGDCVLGRSEEVSGAVLGPVGLFLGTLVALPFDIAFDVLLLPFDVGFWIAGHRKEWRD